MLVSALPWFTNPQFLSPVPVLRSSPAAVISSFRPLQFPSPVFHHQLRPQFPPSPQLPRESRGRLTKTILRTHITPILLCIHDPPPDPKLL
ncbi:hypothetical protein E2C01_038785 [Portunus trituberculatus]|uniref:Uncharacterized protein n=1 Tax=Portunus trituberculatus TaxID=210409 RepID=A0A5B7FBR4_PORTR|nr:hypothetical protein [Portunus trituberculatus]